MSNLLLNDLELNIYACAFIKNLSFNKENQPIIMNNNGLQLLMSCLTSEDVTLRLQAVCCLRNLACNEEYRHKISEKDAVHYLLSCMNINHPRLLSQVLGCLKNLSVSIENRVVIGENNIERILHFLKYKDPHIVINACDLLFNLAIRCIIFIFILYL